MGSSDPFLVISGPSLGVKLVLPMDGDFKPIGKLNIISDIDGKKPSLILSTIELVEAIMAKGATIDVLREDGKPIMSSCISTDNKPAELMELKDTVQKLCEIEKVLGTHFRYMPISGINEISILSQLYEIVVLKESKLEGTLEFVLDKDVPDDTAYKLRRGDSSLELHMKERKTKIMGTTITIPTLRAIYDNYKVICPAPDIPLRVDTKVVVSFKGIRYSFEESMNQ
jgi:hypothetical protein